MWRCCTACSTTCRPAVPQHIEVVEFALYTATIAVHSFNDFLYFSDFFIFHNQLNGQYVKIQSFKNSTLRRMQEKYNNKYEHYTKMVTAFVFRFIFRACIIRGRGVCDVRYLRNMRKRFLQAVCNPFIQYVKHKKGHVFIQRLQTFFFIFHTNPKEFLTFLFFSNAYYIYECDT